MLNVTDPPRAGLEYRRARPLLGTMVDISVPSDACSRLEFSDACDQAFLLVAELHTAMSFHDAGSDIARLCRALPDQVIALQAEVAEVLKLAMWMEDMSGGVFNAAICAPALVAKGLLPDPGVAAPEPGGSLSNDLAWVDVDEGGGHDRVEVRVLRRVWPDVGGIAKGWAVDKAVDVLKQAGMPGGVVNAGGDLRVFGPWAQPVSVCNPMRSGEFIPLLSLQEGAMATTAWQRGAEVLSGFLPQAVVLPPTASKLPIGPHWPSVSVLAPTCAVADALAKVLMILGKGASPLLRQLHADGVGIDREGQIHRV